jgi:hypothetical protein
MLVDNGLELLTRETAWDLLCGEEVGRVGITLGALPVILPVNFVVIDGAIVFRTAPGSKLSAAASGAVVAFEVDSHDRDRRSGWSVLVVGRSEVVHDLDVTFRALAAKLEPFADGRRPSLVRIHPELVSGRRLVHEEKHGAEPVAPTNVVYVADAVDQPFADVCRALTEASAHMAGSIVAVSDAMATLAITTNDGGATAELRVLPIRGGADAMTELLLISTEEEGSPVRHATHVAGARSQLDGIVKTVEDVLSLLPHGPSGRVAT